MQGADLSDCREALINSVIDALTSYQRILGQNSTTLRMPQEGGLQYMPIYVLGLLKNVSNYYFNLFLNQVLLACIFRTSTGNIG
jgi:hypothetical protein